MNRFRRILPALALTLCAAVLLTVGASAATPRELADEYCFHTNAAWCVDSDGDGVRESAPQLHPRFTEEGIEHLREHGRYYDPNDVEDAEPDPTPTPAPTPTAPPTAAPTLVPTQSGIVVTADNLDGANHDDECPVTGTLTCAAGFTTGGASNGYTLDAVNLQFEDTSNVLGGLGDIRVALHASTTSTQGDLKEPAATALATLSGDNPDTAGIYAFECSGSGCNLAPNTPYFIQVTATAGALFASEFYDWVTTLSDAEDLTPANNGWSLANELERHDGTGWFVFTDAPKMRITATTR